MTKPLTKCQALLATIPKDIADRQWVIEAAKILRKHEPMEAENARLRTDNEEMASDPVWHV